MTAEELYIEIYKEIDVKLAKGYLLDYDHKVNSLMKANDIDGLKAVLKEITQ